MESFPWARLSQDPPLSTSKDNAGMLPCCNIRDQLAAAENTELDKYYDPIGGESLEEFVHECVARACVVLHWRTENTAAQTALATKESNQRKSWLERYQSNDSRTRDKDQSDAAQKSQSTHLFQHNDNDDDAVEPVSIDDVVERVNETVKDIAYDLSEKTWKAIRDAGIFTKTELQNALRTSQSDLGIPFTVANDMRRAFHFERDQPGKPRRGSVIAGLEANIHKMRLFRVMSSDASVMEKNCANTGITAALVLTLTFAAFSVVTEEALDSFAVKVALSSSSCVGFWEHYQHMYNTTGERECETRYFDVLGYDVTCESAARSLIADPLATLAVEQRCCLPNVACAIVSRNVWERVHVISNGTASAALICTVLLAGWIHTAVNAFAVRKLKGNELDAVAFLLRTKFLLMQFLNLLGIAAAMMGLCSVMVIKTTLPSMSWFAQVMMCCFSTFVVFNFFSLLRSVERTDEFLMNQWVNRHRRPRNRNLEDRASTGPASPLTGEYLRQLFFS